MSLAPKTRVLLKTDVEGGRVGDECIVVSSKNGWVKVMLVGLENEFSVRKSQIEVKATIEAEVKEPVQLSMYDRWALDV
jgi:hypothetical protein